MVARRSVLTGLVLAFIAPGTAAPRAGAAEPARAFLEDLTDQAVTQLADATLAAEQREASFRRLFRANFDIEAIGQFVLARYWRDASAEQRAAFLATFEDVLVQRFLPLFEGVSGPDLTFGRETRDGAVQDLVIVNSVLRDDNELYRVDWRLSDRSGVYRIVDVVAEGVSLAITYRQEYASVLAKAEGDVDALTRQLRDMVAAGAFKPR